jgi:hypothetical protein
VAFGTDATANVTGVFSGTLVGAGTGQVNIIFNGSQNSRVNLTSEPASPPNAFVDYTATELKQGTWTVKAQVQGITAQATCAVNVPGAANIRFDSTGTHCGP